MRASAVLVRALAEPPAAFRLAAPPGKGETLRALAAFAARGRGAVGRRGPDPDDVTAMVAGLEALGAVIEATDDAWIVRRGWARDSAAPAEVFVAEGAAPARFLTALAATRRGTTRIRTGPRLGSRPFAPLLAALRALGAEAEGEGPGGGPPCVVRGPLRGGTAVLGADDGSSQFASALLLAAAAGDAVVEVVDPAEGRGPSAGYVDLTVAVLRAAGATVRGGPARRIAEPGFRGGADRIDPRVDWSGAAPLLAAGAILGRPVAVRGLRLDDPQPDASFAGDLRSLGISVVADDDGVAASGRPARGGTFDLRARPDLAPTLAALGAFTPGGVALVGAPHLRLKESDRIAATVRLLEAAGVPAEERADGLVVAGAFADGGPGRDAKPFVAPRSGDHRLVQAAALLGLGRPCVVTEPDAVAKSFPGFFEVFPAEVRSTETEAR